MSDFELDIGQQGYKAESIAPGAIIGNYILFQCLGHSTRSSVFACRHKDLEGPMLAIRILNPTLSSDATAAARFHREVVASYTVNHPNIVRTHEFINDGVYVAYTMELMENGNLKELLDLGDLLDVEDVIEIGRQLCQGLQAIHAAGLIHRNLKPGNIFFSSEGEVKIADFGIARADNGPKLTNDGEVLGTVGYTSPEYLQLGEFDHRADIYALGLLLYEMITGSYPYYSPNPVEALRLRITTDPISPIELRPECPLELAGVISKAMARDPQKRYQNVEQLFQDLDELYVTKRKSSLAGRDDARRTSFWRRIPESYMALGAGYPQEKATAISRLRDSITKDLAKRRMAFSGILALFFGILGALLAAWIYSPHKGSLADLDPNNSSLPSAIEAISQMPTSRILPKTATLAAPASGSYQVATGDTLSGIAVKFGISAKELMEANGISDPKKLQVGSTLQIPKR